MPFVEFQDKPTILVFMQIFKFLKFSSALPFLTGYMLLVSHFFLSVYISYAINPFDSDD